MSGRRSNKGSGAPPDPRGVVRRSPRDRKRLPPELEALASGSVDRLRRPPGRPRLADPRAHFLVPGVANRDARAVFDARLPQLRELAAAHREDPDDPEGARRLAEALRQAAALGLWRGRSLTGFDAFVEQLLDLAPAEARALVSATGAGDVHPFSEETVAVWMRAEAAVIEAGLEARVTAERDEDGAERLVLSAESVSFAAAAAAMGARLRPLSREVPPGRPPRPDRGG